MKKICFTLVGIVLFLIIPVVHAESKYLYDVLKDEAESGGLAKEYTGESRDNFENSGIKKIYYWNVNSSNEEEQLRNANNVIFADYCWQMIRTTDTGGVKLLFNGKVKNGSCPGEGENHLGINEISSDYLASNYYYGTDYVYDEDSNQIRLAGEIEQVTWNENTGPELVGKYTCKNTSVDAICYSLYLVESYQDSRYGNVVSFSTYTPYSHIGSLPINADNHSPAYSGYMYNTVYSPKERINQTERGMVNRMNTNQNSNYYYGDKVVYEDGYYYLQNNDGSKPVIYRWDQSYYSLVGKYTCASNKNPSIMYHGESIPSGTRCKNAYYVLNTTAVDNSMIYQELQDGNTIGGENMTISKTVERNGTIYTLTNYEVISRMEFFRNYTKYRYYYYCDDYKSVSCDISKMRYITNYNNVDSPSYLSLDDITYSNSFTYDGEKYILDNDRVSFWNTTDTANLALLKDHHYTCFDTTGVCQTIYYVYETKSAILFYLELVDGKSIEDVLNEMLFNEDVNQKDSTIKKGIDLWFKNTLLSYSDYLEDAVFCNDRSISSIGGWNPNGGKLGSLYFAGLGQRNLNCPNDIDAFSTDNDKARLTYKVGLMTKQEIELLNTDLKTGATYWLGTPHDFYYTYGTYNMVSRQGGVSSGDLIYSSLKYGVRPVISLKKGAHYSSGRGSKDTPYVFDGIYSSVNVEIVDETQDLNVEINDLNQVKQEEEVTFKVTPIKGYQVNSLKIVDEDNNEIEFEETSNKNEYTFVMPASNVTIVPSYERVKSSVDVEKDSHTKVIVIEVNDSKAVVYEDTVKFRITPEDGYEVDTIEIIDSEGNKIEYKKTKNENEYEFVMPDSDVSITPIYRKIENSNDMINPQTGNTKIIIFVIILLSLIGCLYGRKKQFNQE